MSDHPHNPVCLLLACALLVALVSCAPSGGAPSESVAVALPALGSIVRYSIEDPDTPPRQVPLRVVWHGTLAAADGKASPLPAAVLELTELVDGNFTQYDIFLLHGPSGCVARFDTLASNGDDPSQRLRVRSHSRGFFGCKGPNPFQHYDLFRIAECASGDCADVRVEPFPYDGGPRVAALSGKFARQPPTAAPDATAATAPTFAVAQDGALATALLFTRTGAQRPLQIRAAPADEEGRPRFDVVEGESRCVTRVSAPTPVTEDGSRWGAYAMLDVPDPDAACDESGRLLSPARSGTSPTAHAQVLLIERTPTNVQRLFLHGDPANSWGNPYHPASDVDRIASGTLTLGPRGGTLFVTNRPLDRIESPDGLYEVRNDALVQYTVLAQRGRVYDVVERLVVGSNYSWQSPGAELSRGEWHADTQQFRMRSYFSSGNSNRCDHYAPAQWFPSLEAVQPPGAPGISGVWRYSGRSAAGRSPPDRVCMAQRFNVATCEVVACDRWSDDERFAGSESFVVRNRAKADALFAAMDKWTDAKQGRGSYANRGRRRESGGSDDYCGIETCTEQRRRERDQELVNDFIRDVWN